MDKNINPTPEERKKYTKERLLSLKKDYSRWRIGRWVHLVIGILFIVAGILDITYFSDRLPIRYWKIVMGILWIIGAVTWKQPQREYEKAKAIREILDAEEAEKAKLKEEGFIKHVS